MDERELYGAILQRCAFCVCFIPNKAREIVSERRRSCCADDTTRRTVNTDWQLAGWQRDDWMPIGLCVCVCVCVGFLSYFVSVLCAYCMEWTNERTVNTRFGLYIVYIRNECDVCVCSMLYVMRERELIRDMLCYAISWTWKMRCSGSSSHHIETRMLCLLMCLGLDLDDVQHRVSNGIGNSHANKRYIYIYIYKHEFVSKS